MNGSSSNRTSVTTQNIYEGESFTLTLRSKETLRYSSLSTSIAGFGFTGQLAVGDTYQKTVIPTSNFEISYTCTDYSTTDGGGGGDKPEI